MVCMVQSVSHELVHRLDRTTHVAHYKPVNIVPKKQHGYDSQPFRATVAILRRFLIHRGNCIVKQELDLC